MTTDTDPDPDPDADTAGVTEDAIFKIMKLWFWCVLIDDQSLLCCCDIFFFKHGVLPY